eukprot:Blabericola_migrator_1__7528@NODE_3846_length_1471_cov_163_906695_g2385_i0_p2_GENE_NODE_3846_length_1471_cov_163_906695_g2385_i0NODE_3846_length_1471_cov_163_906695_g2385_i0_p2_ORF_typecomplete_len144_score16_38Actin/PF00022_19/3_2e11Synapsin/PF02078_16/5_9e03Synapsin/PF02078_16/0_021_NODE_3846_length_1471_cov_163_906695_g2385_i010391443
MAAQDGNKVLVIDNGGSCIKAGFNKTVRPHVKLANWISQSKKHAHLSSIGEVPGSLNSTGYIVHRPVKAGLLLDIDNQVTVWSHVFDKLNIKEDVRRGVALVDYSLIFLLAVSQSHVSCSDRRIRDIPINSSRA